MRTQLLSSLSAACFIAACTGNPNAPSGSGGHGGQAGTGGNVSSSSGAGGAGAGGADAGPKATPPPFDWVGIVGTGQSLSVGAKGIPVDSTTQPYKNMKLLDSGPDPKYDGKNDMLSLVPLVAPIRPQMAGYPSGPYPSNIYGETIHEGMANQLSATAESTFGFGYTTIHSVVGESGQSITVIKKNGTGKAYASTLYEATAIKALAMTAGKSYGIAAITLTHGETDWADANYEADIHQLWADYNADLPPITGQKSPILMLVSQQSTFPGNAGIRSASTVAQWKLGVDYPGQILCVGPKYQYGYAADHVHFDALNYLRLGEKNAEVLTRATILGEAWKPLQPRSASLAATTITIDFDVPDPPLAFEDTISPPHQTANMAWAKGRGFEVEDSTGPLTIKDVTIAGSSVQIALAAAPQGQNVMVRYAMTQDVAGFTGGTSDARRGQLRDSDPFIGRDQSKIACALKGGSPTITGDGVLFARRMIGDLVSGPGVPDGTVVIAKPTATTVTLSQPVTGADATVELSFHNDQRNYCVQFELAVK